MNKYTLLTLLLTNLFYVLLFHGNEVTAAEYKLMNVKEVASNYQITNWLVDEEHGLIFATSSNYYDGPDYDLVIDMETMEVIQETHFSSGMADWKIVGDRLYIYSHNNSIESTNFYLKVYTIKDKQLEFEKSLGSTQEGTLTPEELGIMTGETDGEKLYYFDGFRMFSEDDPATLYVYNYNDKATQSVPFSHLNSISDIRLSSDKQTLFVKGVVKDDTSEYSVNLDALDTESLEIKNHYLVSMSGERLVTEKEDVIVRNKYTTSFFVQDEVLYYLGNQMTNSLDVIKDYSYHNIYDAGSNFLLAGLNMEDGNYFYQPSILDRHTGEKLYTFSPRGKYQSPDHIDMDSNDNFYYTINYMGNVTFYKARLMIFPDVHQYEYQINNLARNGIIKGFPDGTFKPERSITRLQLIQMILNEKEIVATEQNVPNPSFTDVKPGDYGYEEIATAYDLGIIHGKEDGSFAPTDNVTRAQMAAILVNAYNLQGETDKQFSDVPTGHWAEVAINTLYANNIASGYEDNTYKPNQFISRQHFAVFMNKLLN